MSPSLSPDPADGSKVVRVLENEVTTGAVMTTGHTRSIATGSAELRSDVENKSSNNYFIHFDGNWNHSVNSTENNSFRGIGDNSQPTSASSGPFPRNSIGNALGVPLQHAGLQAGSPADSTANLQSPVLDACEPLQLPESTTPRGYADHFQGVSSQIETAYDRVWKQIAVKRARRNREAREELRLEIRTQKDTYSRTNTSLVKALLNLSSGANSPEDLISELCHDAHDALDHLWRQLHSFNACIEKLGNKNETRSSSENRKKDLTDNFKAIVSRLDDFAEVALSLIQEDSPPELLSMPTNQNGKSLDQHELERLSTEGRASSMLYQCLCRACPEQCHDWHTAYLSLEPDQTGDAPLPSPSDVAPVMWQCHMAFKSTITKKKPLIWLKVVSSGNPLEHSTPRPESDPQEPHNVSGTQTPTEAVSSNPRKRRAASTPPEPSPKAAKTRPGRSVRRISEPAPPRSPLNRLAVCPELLAQHDLDTILVMNMTDDDGYNHSIYYLPKEKRPTQDIKGGGPLTLSVILGKSLGKQPYERMCNERLWIIRLSRLITEAVLRFDLRDSDPNPEESVVFYMSPQNNLAPFLQMVIKKPGNSPAAIEEDSHAAGRRSALLLNLGEILLQLGLPKEERIRCLPQGDIDRRNSIIRWASNVRTHMAPAYYDVIINCVNLSAQVDDIDGDFEEAFKKRYYQNIVQPLRDMEATLPLEGRRTAH